MRLSEGYRDVVLNQSESEYFYELCRLINASPSIDDVNVIVGACTYIHIEHLRSNIRMYLIADFNTGKKSKFMQDLEKLLEWTEYR